MNMIDLLEDTVEKYPSNIFLVRENISFREFQKLAKYRAFSLMKEGIKQGDVVGVLSHNIPELVITIFAIWYLGGICLLMDTNLTVYEYNNMVERVGAKLVAAEKNLIYKTDKFKFFDIETKDEQKDDYLEKAIMTASDTALLSFTSGTTGVSKIVPLSHFNLIECSKSLEDMRHWFECGDIIYGVLPIYHVYGFSISILATLHYGAGVLLQPTINPKNIMSDFSTYKPHVIPCVPRVWEMFYKKIKDNLKAQNKWWLVNLLLKHKNILESMGLKRLIYKIQHLVITEVFGGRTKMLISGGAATKPEIETFYKRLGLAFIQGYGLTETVGPICISKPLKKRFPYAFGAPITNNECDIRNKNDEGIGELWLRGHQVFSGYLNNEQANLESFDDKGFFNTGDLVSMDSNGELHFAGRKKQIIVLDSGKNVYPDELEALFLEMPGIKNVAVFEHTVKDKTVAYGVFSVEENIDFDTVCKYVAQANKKVASYKWVTHFAVTYDDLPMTSTQKVKHHLVKKNLIEGKYTLRKE